MSETELLRKMIEVLDELRDLEEGLDIQDWRGYETDRDRLNALRRRWMSRLQENENKLLKSVTA